MLSLISVVVLPQITKQRGEDPDSGNKKACFTSSQGLLFHSQDVQVQPRLQLIWKNKLMIALVKYCLERPLNSLPTGCTLYYG